MKILVLATKSPWPAVDGGRQLLATTLSALAARGHELTLVFPAQASDGPCPLAACRTVAVAVAQRSRWHDALVAQLRREPLTLWRHAHPEVVAKVEELIAGESFEVVHAEQVQALAAAAPAMERGLPVVLRAQNVESELWSGLAARRFWLRPWLRLEAARLARAEGEALRKVCATVALTRRDRDALAALCQGAQVVEIAAAAPAELPASQALEGSPALVLFGGGSWPPNRDGARFFLERIWPKIAAGFPQTCVHVFGDLSASGERVLGHVSPRESRDAFPQGGILLVPLFIGSGVRMKILESWARGLPVIATPVAARGIETHGGELEIAEDAAGFAAAIAKLSDRETALSAVAAGRRLLKQNHDPQTLAAKLEEVYRQVIAKRAD